MANPTESSSKGLDGIIAAQTRLSDVRGEAGELIYAGYDINELAGKVTSRRSFTCCTGTICPTARNWPN